jgi:hypothetical protein
MGSRTDASEKIVWPRGEREYAFPSGAARAPRSLPGTKEPPEDS